MSEPSEQVEALSPECETYLASEEFYSTADPKIDSASAQIYTSDGEFVVRVSSTISLFDLKSLLQLRLREYARGLEDGKAAKQYEIRSVLGISS